MFKSCEGLLFVNLILHSVYSYPYCIVSQSMGFELHIYYTSTWQRTSVFFINEIWEMSGLKLRYDTQKDVLILKHETFKILKDFDL